MPTRRCARRPRHPSPAPLSPPNRAALLVVAVAAAPGLAAAQAPQARPQGGRVVAGQASIAQTPARTQVEQRSDRAVIEWQRFDIGAAHQVDIRQPGAASWSLQRVVGGDPSAIAGRLTSNGGVALVNPAGVAFANGAQVDVASLIATTADTANEAFMAGRLAFDRASPRPGARVENRGRITVAEQGLAALVGPGVANAGTIQARLGRVALAGGEAFALDLAGDGLLALDVTRQVATAPTGATALVTNAGTVTAEGGQVLLTASAASGLLETLVEAGGRIAAPTLDGRAGTVALRAAGGGVRVDGTLAARGGATGHGGLVEVTAPGGAVRLTDGALVDASGGAGGGQALVGAGAGSRPGQPQRLAASTEVARGARIRADGGRGPGGMVIVHAAERTGFTGTASARGTPGGQIEVSSQGALALDGRLLAGPDGAVLVDPVTLRVVDRLSGSSEPAEITAAAIGAATGALTLQASRTIRVEAAIDKASGSLTLATTAAAPAAGDGIFLFRPVRIAGDLVLRAQGDITQPASGAALDVGTLSARSRLGEVRLEAADNVIRALDGGLAASRFAVTSSRGFSLDAALTATDVSLTTPQAIALRAPVSASGTFDLVALRGATQHWIGAGIRAGLLRIEAPLGAVSLTGLGNRVGNLGDSAVPAGLSLVNEGALGIAGNLVGGRVSLTANSGDLAQDPAGSRLILEELQAVAWGGSVLLDGPLNGVARLQGRARDRFLLDAGGPLLLVGTLTAPEVGLQAFGELAQRPGARLITGRLAVNAVGGAVTLDEPLNEIAALGPAGAGGSFALATATALTVKGVLAAPEVTLTSGGDLLAEAGAALSTALLRATSRDGAVRLLEGTHAIAALAGSGAAGDFALRTTAALTLGAPVEAGGEVRLEAAALAIDAPLSAAALRLRAGEGDIRQGALGALTAASLVAEAPAGAVRLDAAANLLPRFGGSAASSFALATGGDATPDPSLGLAAARLDLTVGGSLFQAADAAGITATRLALAAGGRVELRAEANAIRRLGAMVAPDGLALATRTALRLEEPVSVPALDLTARHGLTQAPGAPLATPSLRVAAAAGGVLLDSPFNALPQIEGATVANTLHLVTGGTLRLAGPVQVGGMAWLQAAGGVTQAASGAGLSAGLLRAESLYGNLLLAGAGNRIAALGGASAAGELVLAQEGTTPLTLAGLVVAPSLTLRPQAGLAEAPGGALRTALLRLDTDGAVVLATPDQHLVGAIGGRAGALDLATAGALAVTEPLAVGGALGLTAASLSLAAPVAAGSARLETQFGDLTQAASGAGLSVGSGGLLLRAGGAIALEGAGNAVARLAGGEAGAGFALASEAAMTVAGAVGGSDLVLRAAGGLTLDGAQLSASRGVLLAAPGGLAAGATSSLAPREADLLPVLILDTRRSGGLTALPAGLQADRPGLAPSAQPTQLAAFGPASAAAAGPAVFDLAVGSSPVFLLLDGGAALGVIEAGRFGLLGQGGSAFVLGTLGGAAGGSVAQGVAVSAAQAGYLFNNCVMGAATCTLPPPAPPEEPKPPEEPEEPVTPPGQPGEGETGGGIVTPNPPLLPEPTAEAAFAGTVPGGSHAPLLAASDLRSPGGAPPPAWRTIDAAPEPPPELPAALAEEAEER